ncbi:type VII secretion-associated serine protease mycosin [Nonomuraea maritima]|uniref:Type VII secretion-associated serine protease mycosin n=1 Tax=Nonomuraea maritima TaxID=683260 RepID=A0A1G9I6T1_9ACTN|nr:S8 family serine peptidase [Nonomuraea maritima]SDL20533.1 type VII secretion-associated serine protease mycosin [Nonomuraea maritima]
MRGVLAALLAAGLTLVTGAAGPQDDVGEAARAGQWQLAALRLPEAWRTATGEGVLVAVLDTGVDARHPDLRGTVIQGPDLTRAGKGPRARHGTAMASLIAGRGHGENHRSGVLGVAPAAKVLSVRVTLENGDPRRGRRHLGRDALAKGIRYAADHGADVISMSLGGGSGSWEGSASEEEAVQYAIGKGCVLVASAGNDGASTNRKNFPAAYPGVIAVGAVDRRLKVAPFSNRQHYVSVVAPGADIVTADPGESYVVSDGTSSAAAMVAGVAALIRAAHPGMSPYHVRMAIELGTRRRPADGYSPAYGHGVVSAAGALREAARLDATARGAARAGTAPASRTPVVAAMVGLALAMSARVLLRRRRRP